ncbi:MAG: FIST C-terminal domain-containing protein [Gammaproteobacteria bacterium]|nr:FIST C-terminal domain-containing protein [Gammaproteobacteria bacterium]
MDSLNSQSNEKNSNKINQSHIKYIHSINESEIKSCCQSWIEEFPDMAVMAYVAESDADKVPTVQAVLNGLNVPLAGAIFPALLYEAEFRPAGLLLVCLPARPSWHLQADMPVDSEALSTVLESIIDNISTELDETEDSTLFMMFDAMVPNIATVLDELYLMLGDSVHYVGVNAGSETFEPMPCLFDNERVVQNGLLAILLTPNRGAILEHGYQAPEQSIMATATTGNRVVSIDWKPAFEVYSERVREQYNVEITRENFYEHAVHFPFGIVRADNEVLVRIPVMLDEDNALFCVGEIPENSVLTLLNAPQAKSLHTVNQLVEKMSDNSVNLLFYCAGRRMHLTEAADNELTDFQSKVDERLNAGALSLGEIGSSHKGGYPLFHNATLVVLPLN